MKLAYLDEPNAAAVHRERNSPLLNAAPPPARSVYLISL